MRVLVASAALVAAAGLPAWLVSAAVVDKQVTGAKYHYQVTDHYCASAAIQMVLDCTAVRTTNPFVNTMLQAPKTFSSQASGMPFPPPQPTYSGGAQSQVLTNPQVAIYNLIHGQATFTPIAGPNTGVPLTYNNPFTPFPVAGSGNTAIAVGLNILDNPDVGGIGQHSYIAYNLAPTIAGGDFATRTIVNAIQRFDIPAQATIGSGAHAITVTGFTTVGTPGRNQPYSITGLYVNDPWTGYVMSEKAQGRNVGGGNGLGIRSWVKYGYKLNPNAPLVFIPGAGMVRASPNQWFKYFNPAPGQPGEGAVMSGAGFKFVVEPPPELPDDGNGGLLDSFPDFAPLLPDFIDTPSEALSAAISALAGSELKDQNGLSGGTFDLSGIALLDPTGEADWLVPYLKAGDISGTLLIDSFTGEIENASWEDVGDEFNLNLTDYVDLYEDIYAGLIPNGNPVFIPEPTGLAFAALVGGLFLGRRRM